MPYDIDLTHGVGTSLDAIPPATKAAIDAVLVKSFPGFKYRANQLEAIYIICNEYLTNDRQTVILDAPTGVGKSWIARQVAEVMNQLGNLLAGATGDFDSLILTKTIALQNQYLRDFPEIAKLMGATNYGCHTEVSVPILPQNKWHETCRHSKTDNGCEYAPARQAFMRSPLKILNYAFYMYGHRQYNTNGLLIADEAHNMPASLIQVAEVEINWARLTDVVAEYDIRDYIPLNVVTNEKTGFTIEQHLPGILTYLDHCCRVLTVSIQDLTETLEEMCGDIRGLQDLMERQLKPLQKSLGYVGGLCQKLYDMKEAPNDTWVLKTEKSDDGATSTILTPLFVPPSALAPVKVPRHRLFMTATPGKIQEDLFLRDTVRLTMPYLFPLNHRPFIVVQGLPQLNHGTRDQVFDDYVDAIDEQLAKFGPTQSGIIHTASYRNATEFQMKSKFKDRIYVPRSHELRNLESILVPGRIYASPSMLEGIDMAGDAAVFQFFLKISYPFLGDEWVRRKKAADPDWYALKSMIDIIQGSGRIIRGPADIGMTMMFDQSFNRLLQNTEEFVPEWFRATIK